MKMATKKKTNWFTKTMAAIGILCIGAMIGLGITYLVKPYNVDVSWQNTETVQEDATQTEE